MLSSASSCFSHHFSSLPNLQLLYDVCTNSVDNLDSAVHDAVHQHNPDNHSNLLGCEAGSLAKCFQVFWRAMMPLLTRVKLVRNHSPNETVSHPRTPEPSATLLWKPQTSHNCSACCRHSCQIPPHILFWLSGHMEVLFHVSPFMILPEFLNNYLLWTIVQPLPYEHSSW
jgi:hypothetical protein